MHRDDNVHEAPERFVGQEVVITEKLDGGNTCLWSGDVYARSTGQPATQGWFAMVKKHHAWKTTGLDPKYQVYGEDLYGIHSIEYQPVKEDQTYRIFNIREGDEWMSWDEVKAMADSLNILHVPERFRGSFDSIDAISKWLSEHIKQPSALGGECEGFVIRHANRFHADDFQNNVTKYVRKGHVQTDQHWTRNWKPIPLEK